MSQRAKITGSARVFLAAFVLEFTAAGFPVAGQSLQSSGSGITTERLQPSESSRSEEQIFIDLVKHNEARSASLSKYSALRTYSVTDLHGKVHAKQVVRMDYVAPDKKKFEMVAEEGSSVVRHLVLNRLMESETSAAAGQDHRDSSITPANYRLRVLGEEDLGIHHCLVVEALPKRRDKYLFEGKIWIDSSEFAIVKIAGHPAKNLSFWITRADFVRRYEKVGDFWLPSTDETFVDVRIYGKKILKIEHRIDSVNGVTIDAKALERSLSSNINTAAVGHRF